MQIHRVTAHAFGHLRGESLELAEGLTVIYGPNESGKSTWHAALLAALCGRWPARARDEPGIERRRPWSGPDWVVSAQARLADGRRVELRHDLAARHGYAKDLDIGVDYSREITASARDVPDASRWLGLDRRAFVATACVRQAHLVLATEDASGVRGYVERAADAAPADATASAALARIDAFAREHVGTERSTTRPLPVAQRRRAEAAAALAAARAGLAAIEEQAATARRSRAEADAALARLRGREAALAQERAQRLRQRAAQARELVEVLGTPAGPADAATEVSTADVAAAIESWRLTLAVAPPSPQPPPAPGGRPGAAAPVAARTQRRRSIGLMGAATALVAVAAGLVAAGLAVAGVVLGLAGLVAGAVGLVRWGRASAATGPSLPPVGGVPDLAEQRRELEQRRVGAQRRVLAMAGQLGLAVDGAPDAVRQLDAWLAADRDRQAARERSAAQRARLEALLDGASLADLDAAADRAQRRAAELMSTVEADYSDVDGDLEALRRDHQEAERRAVLAEQALADLQRRHPAVAEAEERLAGAEAECRRLQALDEVLTRTRRFLARAQERVHRDIAAPLAAALTRDLTAVTAGRYTEAVVDPGSLAVRVRAPGGPLREVEDLSAGTVEQVYLLLRVALAERLVRPGESCPLLLDDVTVHADEERARRLLDMVLAVAQRHQVVLFTQQEQVRRWARATLTGPRHALHELSTPAPP